MGYDIGNSLKSERKKYNNSFDIKKMATKRAILIDQQKFRDAEEKRTKERFIITQEEKGYSRQLIDSGKLSSFIEAFDFIKLEEQELEQIGPFENPRESKSFKDGYEMGKMLVSKGFSEENYHKFLQEYENKYKLNNKKHR